MAFQLPPARGQIRISCRKLPRLRPSGCGSYTLEVFMRWLVGDLLVTDYAQQLKTVNPTQSYTFPIFTDGSVGNTHLLFEGAGIGEAQVTLTVSQTISGISNVLAQSSVFIDLHDIKDFYERTM